ncbi:hypothetical protein J4463_01110 [Candidatus Pacearchaeota archaeon]|nr:hypothetical protein [Candidatus Pacearchaeota archaeon]
MSRELLKQNKKAMSIPSTLLVFLALFLVVTFLFYFSAENAKSVKNIIYSVKLTSDLYERTNLITFYVQDALERGVNSVDVSANNKEELIAEKMKETLDKYRYPDGILIFPEFEKIIGQISAEKIVIINGVDGTPEKAEIELEISAKGGINSGIGDNYKEIASVENFYKKKFSTEFLKAGK